MDIFELLSVCTQAGSIDLELLTSILFNERDQDKILEHIKATS